MLPDNTLHTTSNDNTSTNLGVALVTMHHVSPPPHYPAPAQPLALNPPNTPLIPRMIEALEMGHATLNRMVTTLPDNWGEVNDKGTLITKRILLQCIWGEHTETDGLHNLQQAIVTTYPPTHTNVT